MPAYNVFASFYDILTQNIPYARRGEYFHELFKENGVKSGAILLDLACGTGTLSEIMSGYSYDVIGVDNSDAMLSMALDKKMLSNSPILYLCQSMEQLDLYGTIDCALCALDSLNHLKDAKAVQTAISRVSLFLNPNGIFIFDVNTIYKHEKILSESTFIYDCDEVYCVWQNSKCTDKKIDITLDLFCLEEDGSYQRETEQFCEIAYSHEEMLEFIKNAGLLLVDYYAEDSRQKPTKTCQRVIYVTKKI